MKALVIESSKTMRAVLRRMLSMRGFEVSGAVNSQQAVDVLQKMGTSDLVLVDWNPRETERLEFIARLRRKAARNAIIIMLTMAEPAERELHGALIAGADDCLMKPFTSLQFDEKLERAGIIPQWGR
jgi:two-component system chemotaxis response regulator CheY